MVRLRWAVVVSGLLVGLTLTLPASPGFADPAGNAIHSAGPLTTILTTPDLNCAVNHTGDAQGEFANDTACGTFLAVGDELYSPADIPGGITGTPWIPLSQTVSGAGSPVNPFKIVTDVAAGDTGVTLTQTDTYVVGSESVRTTDVVHNGGAARTVTLYRAGDCFLNDSDTGLGQVNAVSGAVACKSPGSGRIEQWLPLSPGSHYLEGYFLEVWSAMTTREPFPNTCACSDAVDNGAGLSWTGTVASGGSMTRSSLVTFSPTGAAPLTISASATPDHVGPGGEVTYQVTVTNSGNAPTTLTSLIDVLPAGFAYLPGTTTGITEDEPEVDGSGLTWPLDLPVPAQSDLTLRFHATAAQDPGTYLDQATGTSATVEVIGADDAAPVTVDPLDTTPPGAVDDLTATPGDGVVDLDWRNPGDPDLDRIRVFYSAGANAPAFGDGTEVDLGSPHPTHAHVTGLANGTFYSFAAYAVDTSGNVSDSSSVSATPNAATGVDPVTDLQASGASPTSVGLTWNNPSSLDGIVVRYATGAPPATTGDGTGVPVAGTPERTVLDGLTPGTRYFFSVFATAGAGVSPATSVAFTPVDCPDLSGALSAPAGLVTGSTWVACSATDANSGTSSLDTLLPRIGPTQALMTTGDAAIASPPDRGQAQGRDNHSGSRGAHDVSIYRVDLNVPSGTQCLSFDYVFASDEYPEFIGSSRNDGFLAQLDRDDWRVSAQGAITAPGNFAQTPDGGYVDVNGPVFAVASKVAGPATNGTSYDGMSVPLKARTPITPGQHSVYLSVFDAGNGRVDSAALLDNLQVSSQSCQAGTALAPHAVEDFASTPSETPVTTDVLANDSDPSGETLTVAEHTGAAHGTVTCTASACTYTPDAGFVGTDSYTYTVRNTDGGEDVASVSVAVSNRPPDAVDDTASTITGHTVRIDVLANDTDPEDQPLAVVIGSPGASHGSVDCDSTTCVYVPDTGFIGTDSFSYSIVDSFGASDTATVTVTVQPVPSPNAVDDSATTPSGSAVTTNVLANDSDPAGGTLTVTAHTTPSHGTVTCTSSACTYTPAAGFVGTDSYGYTVSGTGGLTDSATVTVTVSNRVPHAVADTATTPANAPVTTNVLANDTDPEGGQLTVTGKTDPTHGSVSCGTSTCTYTPAAGFVGADSYTYTVSDTNGGSAIGTVSVTVTDVPNGLTIAASASTVTWPGTVTVSGVVTGLGGPMSGAHAELWAQGAGGSWAKVDTVTSGPAGKVASEQQPSTGTSYQWRIGDSLTSETAAVGVTPRVTLTAPAAAPVKGKVTFTGTASPVRKGASVAVQAFVGGAWTTVGSSTFASGSTSTSKGAAYSVKVTLGTLGAQRYRAVVAADTGRLEGTSPVRTVSVFRVAVTGVHASGKETVTLKNSGTVAVQLKGWVLRTQSGHRVTLPKFTLKAGATVRLHTGKGKSRGQDVYLGGKPILSDRHDTVTVLDTGGLQVARRSY